MHRMYLSAVTQRVQGKEAMDENLLERFKDAIRIVDGLRLLPYSNATVLTQSLSHIVLLVDQQVGGEVHRHAHRAKTYMPSRLLT